jgi:hypothetical protein
MCPVRPTLLLCQFRKNADKQLVRTCPNPIENRRKATFASDKRVLSALSDTIVAGAERSVWQSWILGGYAPARSLYDIA